MTSANSKAAFFTMEDAKASFNLFCCVCGIGAIFFQYLFRGASSRSKQGD
jgi:hypothetical protein